VAFVVSQGASAGDILDFANARLGKAQRISAVRIVAELPRNHLGKVIKRELRTKASFAHASR
jgi:acyl-coenzyme A synthetase/AMP-(fatty) acid ligase